MRVGVIDIGSNTIKVLCAEKAGNQVKALGQISREARLGGDHKNGQPWLEENKRKNAISAIEELLMFADEHSPEKILLVGTSALREAQNTQQFAQELNAQTGQKLRILIEEEEAKFIGAGVAQDPDIPDTRNFTAFDLGGGSLERIAYKKGNLHRAESYQLGAVRLTREICADNGANPLTQEESKEIRERVRQILPEAEQESILIGSGGAFSVCRTILLSREAGNEDLTTQELLSQSGYKQLSVELLTCLVEELQALPLKERALIPHLPKGRADILPTALHVVLAIAEKYGAQTWHQTFYNLRFGLAASLFRGEFHEV